MFASERRVTLQVWGDVIVLVDDSRPLHDFSKMSGRHLCSYLEIGRWRLEWTIFRTGYLGATVQSRHLYGVAISPIYTQSIPLLNITS